MSRPSVTSLHYNRVLTLVTLSRNGMAQPAVNVSLSQHDNSIPETAKSHIMDSNLECYAHANQFMVLGDDDADNEVQGEQRLDSMDGASKIDSCKSGVEVKTDAPAEPSTGAKATTYSFPWLAIIVVYVIAVLSACKGWGITSASCAVEEAMVGKGFGVIESLNESSAMAAACDEFAALQQCPSWAEGLDYSICDEFGAKVESEG